MLYNRNLENLRSDKIATRVSQIFDTMQYYELIDENALAQGVYDITGILPDLQFIQHIIYKAVRRKTSLVKDLQKPTLNITAFGVQLHELIQKANSVHMSKHQTSAPLIASNYNFQKNNEYNLAIGYYPSSNTYDQSSVKSKYDIYNQIGCIFDISLIEGGLANSMFYINANSDDSIKNNRNTATHGITLEDWLMNFLIESLFKQNGIFHLTEVPLETVSSFTQSNFLVHVNSRNQAIIQSVSSSLYLPQATIFRKKVPL
jgi:hypothetical protein